MMSTATESARVIDQAISILSERVAESGEDDAPFLCWLRYFDERGVCLDYCHSCALPIARSIARYLRKVGREDEAEDSTVDGGWGGPEDGPRFCEMCGCELNVTFTRYAAREELHEFLGRAPDDFDDWSVLRALEEAKHCNDLKAMANKMAVRVVEAYS